MRQRDKEKNLDVVQDEESNLHAVKVIKTATKTYLHVVQVIKTETNVRGR